MASKRTYLLHFFSKKFDDNEQFYLHLFTRNKWRPAYEQDCMCQISHIYHMNQISGETRDNKGTHVCPFKQVT